MLDAQSPVNRNSTDVKQNDQKSPQLQKLAKIQSRSPYDIKIQNEQDFNHRSSPLRRSHSMSLVLHGDTSTPSNFYIDQLQRFRRNHEVKNKEQRERQKEIMMQKLQQKRSLQIQRQQNNRNKQEEHLRSLIQKNSQILQGHKQGLIRNNTYHSSLPVNPITFKYETNLRGRYQQQADDKAQVRKLVRGHHLQTMGTSGYNVLNGAPIDRTSKLFERNKEMQGLYEQKLEKFYANLKLRAPSLEETRNLSNQKGFKYH